MKKPQTVMDKVRQRARLARAEAETEGERKRKAREKERKLRAKANESTPGGLNRKFACKLQAAAQKAEEDPKAKAFVERAKLLQRIQLARRAEGKDPSKPDPNTFMGMPQEEYDKLTTTSAVTANLPDFPKSMAELRSKKTTKKRARRNQIKSAVDQAKEEKEQADRE